MYQELFLRREDKGLLKTFFYAKNEILALLVTVS